MRIDRTDSRPLHAQVAGALRAQIRDRTISPGDTLPSEASLCERFGVSRSVVRQALSTLEDEGTVRRAPGRAPVAVGQGEHRRLVQRVTGLFDQFDRTGLSLRTRVLRLERTTAPRHIGEQLGTKDVLLLERLRSVEDGPLAYVRTWLPASRIEGLTATLLTDASLHRLLQDRFGIRLVSGRRQIRAVPADDTIAGHLGIPAGAPLLLLEGSSSDRGGAPVEWFESWHRSDRIVFDIDADESAEQVSLHPAAPPGAARPPERAAGTGAAPPSLSRARSLVAELAVELDRAERAGRTDR
ncbi:GntR family transcriptional regulator [Spinactinospora alkalitolerans]|uniref:GntR family transcriptional regulator n=1 Tax=Spinactinospora alkalitolerans TaxID=687207 RepID=A0A852TVX4_9ACTN|nr:GntR family transcriptional regulator [Spinactinospora alkalitolerans]NYE47012.1 GntR family transcriptional regulator [Spinactinospora alkalitolerans]